jgi:hypothetical protein
MVIKVGYIDYKEGKVESELEPASTSKIGEISPWI